MNTDIKKWLQIIFRFLLLALLVYAVYKVLYTIWGVLTTIDTPLAVGVLTASTTIFVSVISVLVSKHFEQKAIIKNEQRLKKIPIYEKLIEFTFKILTKNREGKKVNEVEVIEFMTTFTQELIVWGSDEVVLSFYKFRQESINPDHDEKQKILFSLEELLLAVRKDLGHSNTNIHKGKILGLFIDDISSYIK